MSIRDLLQGGELTLVPWIQLNVRTLGLPKYYHNFKIEASKRFARYLISYLLVLKNYARLAMHEDRDTKLVQIFASSSLCVEIWCGYTETRVSDLYTLFPDKNWPNISEILHQRTN